MPAVPRLILSPVHIKMEIHGVGENARSIKQVFKHVESAGSPLATQDLLEDLQECAHQVTTFRELRGLPHFLFVLLASDS